MSDAPYCHQTGKLRHSTLAEANDALARSRTGGMSRASEVSAFHCRSCSGFHIGHQGWRGRRYDLAKRQRHRGPRLSGTPELREALGIALANGDRARAAEIVAAILNHG